MIQLVKLIDVWGNSVYVNINEIECVKEDFIIEHDNVRIDTWLISLKSGYVQVNRDTYSKEAFFLGLQGDVPTLYKDYEARRKTKQEEQAPSFVFPPTLGRYEFKYRTPKSPFKSDAQDFIYSEEQCYFMDGDPLEAKAMSITTDMSKLLLDNYDFNNPVRNLSWIEVGEDRHLALLFNNRAKS